MTAKLELFMLLSFLGTTSCFIPSYYFSRQRSHKAPPAACTSLSLSSTAADGDDQWISLTDDDAVRKIIISRGNDGDAPRDGDEVAIEYVGTLADRSWSARDVIDCWLSEQQGLDDSLASTFLALDVDGSRLLDGAYFTESFVAEDMGVENRIQCKKLVMAARRLAREIDEFPSGSEFDSSKERGAYKFVLGTGKVIKATELAVGSMNRGERAKIVARSDYAYGKEGLRRGDGDVMVPPFATLEFDVTLVE